MPKTEKMPNDLEHRSANEIGVKLDTSQTQYSINIEEFKTLNDMMHGDSQNKKSVNRSYDARKLNTEYLADSFDRLSIEYRDLHNLGLSDDVIRNQHFLVPRLANRSMRLRNCGHVLEWWKCLDFPRSKWKLSAHFCKDRMCPMCAYRRTLKIYKQLSDVLNYIETDSYTYVFLTLTVPNCNGEDLKNVCERMIRSFENMLRRSELKDLVKGYFRAFEVTFNHNFKSKSFMTFHPHMHIILVLPKSYFSSRSYIKHDVWLQMWRDCYGDQNITQVDVRKIKSTDISSESLIAKDDMEIAMKKAILETSKYSVKSSDYIFKNNKELTDYSVKYLTYALRGLRMYAFGGVLKDASNALNLEDVMSKDANLSDISADNINTKLAYMVVRYKWGDNKMYELLLNEDNKCIEYV